MRAPLVFVLLALLLLLAIPVIVDARTASDRRGVADVAEPARTEVTHIQLGLAVAGSLLSDYVISRADPLLERHQQALSDTEAAYGRLEPLASKLGPDVSREYEALGSRFSAWRTAAGSQLGGIPGPAEISAQQQLYEDLLITTARLDAAISSEAQRLRAAISAADRIKVGATFLLVPIAVVAALVVARLGIRLSLYAQEADRGRMAIARLMESKARLLRGFSHDVQNPLCAADGYAELLGDGLMGPLNPRQMESVHRIRASLDDALRIIGDLLEISHAEVGDLEIRRDSVDVAALVRDTVAEHQASALASGFRLISEISHDVPVIETDPARVRQMLGNLISNALKYAFQGEVVVTLEGPTRGPDLDGRWMAIRVKDTGPGIPAAEQERIFEEFFRLDPGTKPGTGLGLAISRHVARCMGGDLTVTSARGLGSTFTIWLPMEGRGVEWGALPHRPDVA